MNFRVAQAADIDLILSLIQAFYAEDGDITFVEYEVRRSVLELIADRSLGAIWIIEMADHPAGYIVFTLGYSLEFHGRDALIDELYIKPEYRGRNLGIEAIRMVEAFGRERGVRAVHLEADEEKYRLREYYRRAGYGDHRRRLMTRWLSASPAPESG